VNEFEGLLKLAYSHIRDKEFESAVELYHTLEKKFKSLPKYKKTRKLHQDILVLYKEISLYLRINEAYLLAQQGETDKLKNELDHITNLSKEVEELPGVNGLLEYSGKHYNFCLDVYTYKTTAKNFNHLLTEAKGALDNNDVNNAMKCYSQLLIVYNNLIKFEDHDKRIEIYYETKDLFRDLEMHTLIKKAYNRKKAEAKGYEIKPPKLLKKDKGFNPRKLPQEYKDSQDDFARIRDTLNGGNYSKAQDMYKKL